MDCFMNKNIPKSTSSSLIFKSSGQTFITGISSSYDYYYDKIMLNNFIKEEQFNYLMDSLMSELFLYWPCTLCYYFGFICSPCTLGLSFLIPNTCVNKAKMNFNQKLKYYNINYFHPKSLHLSLKSKCYSSWLQLDYLNCVDIDSNIEYNQNFDIKKQNTLVSVSNNQYNIEIKDTRDISKDEKGKPLLLNNNINSEMKTNATSYYKASNDNFNIVSSNNKKYSFNESTDKHFVDEDYILLE